MKKQVLLFIVACFVVSLQADAQTKENKWGWPVLLGINQYDGDVADKSSTLENASLHTGLKFYLNSSFNLAANVSAGQMDLLTESGTLLDYEFALEYKLNNGYLISEDAKLKPYIYSGIGGMDYDGETNRIIPIGLGLRYKVYEDLDFQLASTYHMAKDDAFNYFQHTFGVVITPSRNKESSPKPIAKVVEELPKIIDTDNDGIADELDKCPQVAGPASNQGCPEVKDADNDGVPDDQDECPNVAGSANLNGCPDSDNDGIIDSKDSCPQVAGTSATNGCPDRDNDGIADGDDSCPDVAGIAANRGCPEIEEEVKKILEHALTGIQFESGRDVIKSVSYTDLNNIAKIMGEHNEYKLTISGHTDNTGREDLNLALSGKRAQAAMKYLVNKGVNANRMTAKGYGITQPIADNNTRAGRATNRRVEFKIVFE